jgi:hypothetical protein
LTGNVGIGTTPHATYKVDVNGILNATSVLINGSAITGSKWTTSGNNIHYTAGNVGIGTTNVFVPLQVYHISAATLRMQTTASGTPSVQLIRGDTTDASTDWIMSNNPTTGAYSITSSTSGTAVERFVISNGGNVGIGITNPTFRLEIVSTTASSSSLVYRFFNAGQSTLGFAATSFNDVCAKINGTIWITSYFATSSDSRIKEDIQDINDDTALNMILAIEPKTYKYIDKVERGDKTVYGFIAQQIREVIPEAVSIQKSYIPNIMLLADYDNHIITLPSQPTKVIIKLNDKIRCYDKDNKIVDVEVDEVIDELTFKIKEIEYTDNKIFVSGTEIDDFHTLDKSYIFTLNVCATQELHRRIKSQETRINELETKITQILNNMSV